MAALALEAIIEVIGRILCSDHPNLKHQILSTHSDPSNRPPLEECPHLDPVQLRDLPFHELPRDPAGVGGEVVVGWERDPADIVQIHGEIARCAIQRVIQHVRWEQSDWETLVLQLVVC